MQATIEHIIENFVRQKECYQIMLELARQQWSLLNDRGPGSDEIRQLLVKRQDLLVRIMELNRENKELQACAVRDIGIDHFVLSELGLCLEAATFGRLQECIGELSGILESINSQDKANQRFMESVSRTRPEPVWEKTSNQQAQQAYRNSMEHKRKV